MGSTPPRNDVQIGIAKGAAGGDLFASLYGDLQLDECESRLRRSDDALRRQYPPGYPTLGTQATEMAQLAVARGKPAEARQYLRAALKIFSENPRKVAPGKASEVTHRSPAPPQ